MSMVGIGKVEDQAVRCPEIAKTTWLHLLFVVAVVAVRAVASAFPVPSAVIIVMRPHLGVEWKRSNSRGTRAESPSGRWLVGQ